MTDLNIIFQRTQSGRDEIYNKSHGLTQSERLVLIMIDGVTSYKEVRAKLPVLAEDRFNRALLNLQKKELILEVFMPLEGQAADDLESTVIDRFLQQDPMDPLTLIFVDPEEELGIPHPAPASKRSEAAPPKWAAATVQGGTANTSTTEVAESSRQSDDDMDFDDLIELADTVEKEVRARHSERGNRPRPAMESIHHARERVRQHAEREQSIVRSLHWGYWLIGVGIAFIGGFLLARITP
jgi:hypothetical protein